MKTNTYKVTVLNMGHVNVDKGGMTRGTDCGVKMRIPQQAIAVEGNGLKIILDTGVHSFEWVNANISTVDGCVLEEDESLAGALAHIGWKPEEVDYVVNTHLHYDHCGGNYLFKGCKTKFYIQKKEWDFALAPTPNQTQYYMKSLFDESAVDPEQIVLIDGEMELADGIVIFPTPGHTAGHQSVLINTEEGVVCYAGDAANLLENLKKDIIGNILFDTKQAFQAMDDIRRMSEFVICGHEPKITKYQSGGFLRVHDEM